MEVVDYILQHSDKIGAYALLLIGLSVIVLGGANEWFVTGREFRRTVRGYEDRLAEKDGQLADSVRDASEWKGLALAQSGISYAMARQQHPDLSPPPKVVPEVEVDGPTIATPVAKPKRTARRPDPEQP